MHEHYHLGPPMHLAAIAAAGATISQQPTKTRLASSPVVSQALEVRIYSSLVPRPSSFTSCQTRPSASLSVPNEAGRPGDDAYAHVNIMQS